MEKYFFLDTLLAETFPIWLGKNAKIDLRYKWAHRHWDN
jgi:hypothetical protein